MGRENSRSREPRLLSEHCANAGQVEGRGGGNVVVSGTFLGLVKGFKGEAIFGRMRHHRNDLCVCHYPGSGPGGRRFKSFRPTNLIL